MHPWRPVAIVGTAFAAVSLLFPFVSFPVLGVVDGISADAWPALIPLLPVAIVAATGDWSVGPPPWVAVVLVLMACAAVLFAVVKAVDAALATQTVGEASVGAGPIVLVAGTLIALGGCVLALARS